MGRNFYNFVDGEKIWVEIYSLADIRKHLNFLALR